MADSQQKLKQVTLQGLKTKRNTRTKKKQNRYTWTNLEGI